MIFEMIMLSSWLNRLETRLQLSPVKYVLSLHSNYYNKIIELNVSNRHMNFSLVMSISPMFIENPIFFFGKTFLLGWNKDIYNILGLTGMFENDVLVQKSNLIKWLHTNRACVGASLTTWRMYLWRSRHLIWWVYSY